MSYSIITDPQVSPPDLDRVASEGRTKYSKLVEAVHNDWETYIKKNLKNWLLKHNQMVQVTLKEFIDYFQQYLNNSASALTAIEETTRIMREEHKIKISISIGMIWIHKTINLNYSIGSLEPITQ